MAVDSHIKDGAGSGQSASVLSGGGVKVYPHHTPPDELTVAGVSQIKQLQGLLADSTGSVDLAIDGSTTAVEFTVSAPGDRVYQIYEVRFVFHSTNMKLDGNEQRRFGPVAAPGLGNGLRLFSCQDGIDVEYANVQVTGEFYRYARTAGGGIGDNAAVVNRVDAISAGVDLLVVAIDFIAPIGLFPGTTDKISVSVRDDPTGIALFEVTYGGTQEIIT